MQSDMEFDEHEDLEEEEEEEEEEEDMGYAVPPGYDSLGISAARSKTGGDTGAEGGAATALGVARKNGPTGTVRYRECQKNHAVSIGGHAVDGCCEFLAAGQEGTLEAVICAACNCHRNFHRKEIGGEITPYQPRTPQQAPAYHHQFSPYYHRAAAPPGSGYLHHLMTPPLSQHRPLALPAAGSGGFSREEEDVSNPSSSGGTKKRHRTRFTAEQKDKMLEFAERVGWRIQKQDEGAVEQFCEENCIKRHVLKVWMHNNKHTLGKKP